MCRTRGWTGLRPMVFTLGLVAATAGGAQAASMSASVPASPLLAYNTVGSSVGGTGISGNPVINFIPATGAVISPTNLSFGKFEVLAPADGSTTTYSNTPFTIQLKVDSVNSTTPVVPNQSPITVTGLLNGTVSGASRSEVVATFNPLAKSDFQTGLYVNTLGLPNSPLNLVPSTVNNGDTSLQASMTSMTAVTQPVPEPSTIALFAATIIGLGFRRRMLARRAA
jgi:PEP-CTERM motif